MMVTISFTINQSKNTTRRKILSQTMSQNLRGKAIIELARPDLPFLPPPKEVTEILKEIHIYLGERKCGSQKYNSS